MEDQSEELLFVLTSQKLKIAIIVFNPNNFFLPFPIGPFKTAKMEDTTIEDLTIRLGYPYVYVHQVRKKN